MSSAGHGSDRPLRSRQIEDEQFRHLDPGHRHLRLRLGGEGGGDLAAVDLGTALDHLQRDYRLIEDGLRHAP